ncbi:hypothetical protein Ancab_008548 [Ancistrocladus abbreviatus]
MIECRKKTKKTTMKEASVSKLREAHKQTTKGSNLVLRREAKQQSSRNPLKDLNAFAIFDSSHATASSSSSSYSTAPSTEAPGGCLRFLLSHHSTSCSRTPVIRKQSVAKSPKSVPSFRPAESRFRGENVSKPKVFRDPQKPKSKLAQKFRTNPPCVQKCQSGMKPSLNAGFKLKIQPVLRSKKGDFSSKSSSGSENLMPKKQENIALKVADDAGESSLLTLPCDGDGDGATDITPLTKLASGASVASDSRGDGRLKLGQGKTNISPTPPVEASVSPEIRCGSSSLVSKTPPCYGAGHVVLGVTDKRKCRPRGVLTVEDNDFLGFGKLNVCDNDDMKSVNGVLVNPRDSIVPSPMEASLRWISPSDEKVVRHDKDDAGYGSDLCQTPVDFKVFNRSSPLSSHVFSSELSNSSKSGTTTSDATNNSRSVSFFFSPDATSGFQRFLGPSDCSENRASQISPACMVDGNFRYDYDVETTPYSGDSSGSGNVIQTPQSDTSSDKCIGLTPLNDSEIQKLQFKHELDSLESYARKNLLLDTHISTADHLGMDFEVDHPTTPANLNDLAQSPKAVLGQGPCFNESMLPNLPESNVKISWRDGLVSQSFEVDEVDCCRLFSDEEEEEDINACSKHFNSLPSTVLLFDKTLTTLGEPAKLVGGKLTMKEENFPAQGLNHCAESISTDGGSLFASEDSDCMICYKDSFEV